MSDDLNGGGRTPPPGRRHGHGTSEEDRLEAVVRNPTSVYVYWNLGGFRSRKVVRELGPEAEWILRVLDLTLGSSNSVAVSADAGSVYVEVSPGHTYGFELACRAGQKWRTVCRTDRVEVPPREPGSRRERPVPPVSKLRQPDGSDVPGLRYETTQQFLATSPGPPQEDKP